MTPHSSPARAGSDDLRDRFESVAPVILVDPEPVVRRGRRRRAMARAGASLGVAALVLAVVLVARPGAWSTGPAVTTPPPLAVSEPVALQVLPAVVAPGGVVTVVLVASAPNDLVFGVAAEVERWDGRGWRRTGAALLCLVEWACVGSIQSRLDAVEAIGLSASSPDEPGIATVLSTEGLDDGWYRLVQEAAGPDAGVATGVFEVRTDALAAPPHPEKQGVRLAVVPALVPPAGGVVQVSTQVPADAGGNLSAEDIEEVDSALDPSVLIQRWDGEEWVDVVDAPVGERAADLGVEWGSPVNLPELDEGSYRLLRTWAGQEAPWGVFTVATGAPALPQPSDDDVVVEDVLGEDAWAPDHEQCQNQPGRCLLEAWWRDVVAEAGIERGGGDHDIGLVLTDSVRVPGPGFLSLSVVPREDAPVSDGYVTVTSTTQVGDVTVEAGSGSGVPDLRRLTCGGLVMHTSAVDVDPADVDAVVTAIATAMQSCPADLGELAERYPEIPPVTLD